MEPGLQVEQSWKPALLGDLLLVFDQDLLDLRLNSLILVSLADPSISRNRDYQPPSSLSIVAILRMMQLEIHLGLNVNEVRICLVWFFVQRWKTASNEMARTRNREVQHRRQYFVDRGLCYVLLQVEIRA